MLAAQFTRVFSRRAFASKGPAAPEFVYQALFDLAPDTTTKFKKLVCHQKRRK
jgi:hypothetical protein